MLMRKGAPFDCAKSAPLRAGQPAFIGKAVPECKRTPRRHYSFIRVPFVDGRLKGYLTAETLRQAQGRQQKAQRVIIGQRRRASISL